MTDRSQIPDSSHPTAILLPFYINGTLSEHERQEVERHLSECQSCQQELAELRSVQSNIKSYFSELPQPSTEVFSNVKAKMLAEGEPERTPSPVVTQPLQSEALGARLQEFLHSIFSTQWAPALAMCLILGQAVILFWTITTPLGQDGSSFGPVRERSIPQAPAPEFKLRLAFVEDVTELTIRTTIQNLRGRIVDGPTSEGTYTVAVSENDSTRFQQLVQDLVAQKDVIRLVEPLSPPR